jgi:hypothetical protein
MPKGDKGDFQPLSDAEVMQPEERGSSEIAAVSVASCLVHRPAARPLNSR